MHAGANSGARPDFVTPDIDGVGSEVANIAHGGKACQKVGGRFLEDNLDVIFEGAIVVNTVVNCILWLFHQVHVGVDKPRHTGVLAKVQERQAV